MHKLKEDKPNTFSNVKSWTLDDVKTMEPLKGNGVCINISGKPYYWLVENLNIKIELLHTIVTQAQKFYGKGPKLFGIDEELLNDQMEIARASKPSQTAQQASRAPPAAPATSTIASPTPVKRQALSDMSYAAPPQVLTMPPAAAKPVPGTRTHVASPTAAISPTTYDLEAFLMKETETKQTSEQSVVFDLDELLGGFNWQVNGDAADLERKLEAELQALEAANVHAVIESEEDAERIIDEIDATLGQLETIDSWLLHYTTLLDKMGQDVHSVEVRNKALQVTSTNQKLLLQEIESIVSKMKLTEPVSQRLKYESLEEASGIKSCERAVSVLMEIVKIKFDDMIADISMIKERHGLYQSYAADFAVRFTEFMNGFMTKMVASLATDKSRTQKLCLTMNELDAVQTKFAQYFNLINWLKLHDARKHFDIRMNYTNIFGKFYKSEFHQYIENLKQTHTRRKILPDEQDYSFTISPVSVTAVASNAISVIGSKALEKGKGGWNMLGNVTRIKREEGDDDAPGTPKFKGDKGDEDKIWPDEAMNEIYASLCPMVVTEMNMVMDLFDLKAKSSESETVEFSHEWLESLSNPREKLKEFRQQNRLNEVFDLLFDVHDDICSFFEWSLKYDPTFAVGMMNPLEERMKAFAPTAYQNFSLQMELLMSKITLNFERYVDEQIKAIEETKITYRKRNGILPCIRTFPKFVDHMEKLVDGSQGQSRASVTNAYSRIVKSIFETLETLAKDHNESAKDSKNVDDKESLNMHILNIENMHHFHAEIRARKIQGLEQFVKASKAVYDQNIEVYIKIVIRKPLGKLLEFFEGVDNLLKSLAPEEVSFHLQYSKVTLRDVLKKYPGKEIKKGLEALYKKVEKNFTDEDGSLLQVIWRGIQEAYTKNLKRYEEIIALCYPETGLKVEFTIEDLLGYFSDLAQNH
ncbi:exocyst complex component Sec3-domain-containing protein [Chytriomyces sp. MP71]|nr:exocyst complex component Sec3-domain-containing protein [Chytriomyces sp. MP71]